MHTPVILALNHLLRQSAWARDRLASFAGKRVNLMIGPLQIPFVINDSGLLTVVANEAERPADVEIQLPADTPLRLLSGGTGEAMKAARITGAADLADALGFVLRNLRWDAEEDLSRVVGDIAAHRLAGGIRAFAEWQQDAARRLAENLTEYAVHEKPTVLGAAAFKVFSEDLARFSEKLDSLKQRAAKLR
jgi:ubiquinone biosynthesis protein UbiJ